MIMQITAPIVQGDTPQADMSKLTEGPAAFIFIPFRGTAEARTRNPRNAIAVRHQLRHSPMSPQDGFDTAISGLSVRCPA